MLQSFQYLKDDRRIVGSEIMKYYRIKELREDSGLNQTALANILGMSQTGYSKYETGENDVPTTILIKLADHYHTSADYILGRTDKKQSYPPSIQQPPEEI